MTVPRTMGDAAWWLGSRSFGVLGMVGLLVIGIVVLGLLKCF